MNLDKINSISRNAWLDALHVKGTPDNRLREQIDEAERLIMTAAAPKAIYKVLELSDIELKGTSIKRHLEDCEKVIVMAVTLGAGVDILLRRVQITDMALAVIIDSGASILTEQYCDAFQNDIASDIKLHMTPRFSPGYGDYPVEEQKKIVKLLETSKLIGLNLTSTNIMIPRKSVTAIIGLADHPVKGHLATCDECKLKDKCNLRKEGKTCGN